MRQYKQLIANAKDSVLNEVRRNDIAAAVRALGRHDAYVDVLNMLSGKD